MSAAIAAASAAALGGVVKGVTGISQINKANKLRDSNIFVPESVPNQVQTATDLAAQNYYNGMPGQTQAQTAIGRNASNAFYNGSQGATTGGDVLDLAARIGQNTNDAQNQLAGQNAMFKSQALNGYLNALNTQAGWQDKIYNNNIKEPYQQTAQTAAALYGAGNINLANGIDGITNAATTYASDKATTDAYNNNPNMATALALKKGRMFGQGF